jgi:transcription initiation factor TFIIH subunit 2
MAPRKDDDFMDVDSESDISIPDDAEDIGARKGKGKAKAGDKRKRDKGKAKAKDAVNNTSFSSATRADPKPPST